MNSIGAISFRFKDFSFDELSSMHVAEAERKEVLQQVKSLLKADELLFLSTCNRIEFYTRSDQAITDERVIELIQLLNPQISESHIFSILDKVLVRNGLGAVHHLFSVASSLDSMVVGEREIITQIRTSFEECEELGLIGDYFKLMVRKAIECAKKVYTDSNIAKHPVSVVSVGFRALKEAVKNTSSHIVLVGAGATIRSLVKLLKSSGYKNVTVYNRSLEKANKLREIMDLTAIPLDQFGKEALNFDALIACTGAQLPTVTEPKYKALRGDDSSSKFILDLGLPSDVDANVAAIHSVNYIGLDSIKEISDNNLNKRKAELIVAEEIINAAVKEFMTVLRERQVELAMSEVPVEIRRIHETAINSVFDKELSQIPEVHLSTVHNLLAYIEKKYISIPMKMAREIITKYQA